MIEGKTKADYRARREMVGLTQGDVAEALGVTAISAQRWEREGFPDPPADAWNLIGWHEALQSDAVADVVDGAVEGKAVELVYFRTAEEAASLGLTEPIGVLNANAREAARVLDALGFEVRFRYPSR